MTDSSNQKSSVPEKNSVVAWSDCIAGMIVESGPLIARCHPAGDRTGHTIWCRSSIDDVASTTVEPTLVLISIEGAPDELWPASAPFQQIVSENVGAGGKPVFLAVGMAGRTHWSGTIEGDSMTEAIAMDIAARVATVPDRLGAIYQIAPQWTVGSSDSKSILLHHPNGLAVTMESIGAVTIEYGASEKLLILSLPIDSEMHRRGQTYRWRYVIRI